MPPKRQNGRMLIDAEHKYPMTSTTACCDQRRSGNRRLLVMILGCCVIFLGGGIGQVLAENAARIDLVPLQNATVRILSGNDTASGVLVSNDGLVLTVAHGIHPELGPVRIKTIDGMTHTATSLARNEKLDVAVLRIDNSSKASFQHIALASEQPVRNNDSVFSLGYPGRTPDQLKSTVRIGTVVGQDQSTIRTSCVLTVGDSGGPLLNSRGHLIGIHRQIGLGTGSNLHVPISSVLRVLKDAVPAQTSKAPDDPVILSPDSILPSSEVVAALRSHTITIVADDSNAQLIGGTLMTSNLVATKLSELPDVKRFKCLTEADQQRLGDLWHSDRSSDLAIIRLAEPVEVKDIESTSESDTHSAPGCLIFSLTENRIPYVGVISFAGQPEPDLTGRMGARFALTAENSVVLSELFPNGAAALAGLHVDDQLQDINGQKIESLDDVADALRSFQPGDRMIITSKRQISDPTMTSIRLHHDVGARFESTEFLDGRSGELSERRSGFASVIQHDIPVRRVDCGAPVCDSEGRIIGINIARRSREATLVLPIQRVLDVIREHKDADSTLKRTQE